MAFVVRGTLDAFMKHMSFSSVQVVASKLPGYSRT